MNVSKAEIRFRKSLEIHSDDALNDRDLSQIDGFLHLIACQVQVRLKYIENMDAALCELAVRGKMKIRSTRTRKPLEIDFANQDALTYAFSETPDPNDDTILAVNGDTIDLHDPLVSLVVSSLPIKIVGEDEPENFSGDQWEVISEDEYRKRSRENEESPFCILSDFDPE